MMKITTGISLALLLAAAPLRAQQSAASSTSCKTADAFDQMGISGIACNCTAGPLNKWTFRTEPRVRSLAQGTNARALLRVGDVITELNGKSLLTQQGMDEVANVHPGQAVVLTVRRGREILQYALRTESDCSAQSTWVDVPVAPAAASPGAIADAPTASTLRSLAPRAAMVAPAVPSRVWTTAVPAAIATYRGPRASYGMSFSCSHCSMRFSEKEHLWSMMFSKPPVIYSIERRGPADKAGLQRGDSLTHVNGKRIDSDEGGRIFAEAKPGQTLKFTVQRDGESRTFTVRPTERSGTTPALAGSYRAAYAFSAVAPVAAGTPGTRTLRYTGTLAGTDVEVRGAPVSVSETEDEIVITTGPTVVRVQKKK